jgi:hypothetical protein
MVRAIVGINLELCGKPPLCKLRRRELAILTRPLSNRCQFPPLPHKQSIGAVLSLPLNKLLVANRTIECHVGFIPIEHPHMPFLSDRL